MGQVSGGVEYLSTALSLRGDRTKTKRERERAHAETIAIIKNGGAGVDGARTAVMVWELFGRWRARSVVSYGRLIIDLLGKISLSARISLFASSQVSLTPQISLFST